MITVYHDMITLCVCVCVQVVFALGALIDQYVVMEIGRFIFGLAGA